MKLTDKWFTAITEAEENDRLIIVCGRDQIQNFIESGKLRERVEIYWKYAGDEKGMPAIQEAKLMEDVQDALRSAMEKDKLAILTGVYTGNNERTLVFYTRNIPAFGEMLNKALAGFDRLPIEIYTEKDAEWNEYTEMYELHRFSETDDDTDDTPDEDL